MMDLKFVLLISICMFTIIKSESDEKIKKSTDHLLLLTNDLLSRLEQNSKYFQNNLMPKINQYKFSRDEILQDINNEISNYTQKLDEEKTEIFNKLHVQTCNSPEQMKKIFDIFYFKLKNCLYDINGIVSQDEENFSAIPLNYHKLINMREQIKKCNRTHFERTQEFWECFGPIYREFLAVYETVRTKLQEFDSISNNLKLYEGNTEACSKLCLKSDIKKYYETASEDLRKCAKEQEEEYNKLINIVFNLDEYDSKLNTSNFTSVN